MSFNLNGEGRTNRLPQELQYKVPPAFRGERTEPPPSGRPLPADSKGPRVPAASI
jgi:hypothetical protein